MGKKVRTEESDNESEQQHTPKIKQKQKMMNGSAEKQGSNKKEQKYFLYDQNIILLSIIFLFIKVKHSLCKLKG